MSNNISPYVGSQLPEYLRGDSPLFTAFIETYYKYVEMRENSIGMIHNRHLDFDIDETLDKYVSEFYATYGEYIPSDIAMDKRNFIKLLSDVYNAKGTQKSLKLLFRALFNQDIKITYPSEQILRASDGIWEVDKFITVVTKFGVNPVTGDVIVFNNEYGDFVIDTTKIIQISPDTHRIYFKTYSLIKVSPSQLIYVYNSDGEVTYVGGLIKSPSELVVSNGGKDWQVGQIITVDGDGMNTIARVSSINSLDGIVRLEILEYGIHNENQIVLISPYPNRPSSSNLEIESVLVSVSPDVRHHNISIHDYTDGIFEKTYGVIDSIDENSYFLDGVYVDRGYFGTTVINQVSSVVPPSVGQTTGITIQDWLDSRATLIYKFDYLISTRGYFLNENGQLSNQFIRLEDNYFYQPFSYVIETNLDIREYRDVLNITHPVGTKRFSILEKTANYNIPISWSRTISIDTTYFTDSANIFDSLNFKDFGKNLVDSVNVIDFKSITLNKSTIVDSVTIVSLDITNTVTVGYDDGTYFANDYAAHEHTLTIG
jgi:hypothetical protein